MLFNTRLITLGIIRLVFNKQNKELLRRYCRSQYFSATISATLDHIATVAGRHPLTETMSTFTANTTRLISSFHYVSPPKIIIDKNWRLYARKTTLVNIFV